MYHQTRNKKKNVGVNASDALCRFPRWTPRCGTHALTIRGAVVQQQRLACVEAGEGKPLGVAGPKAGYSLMRIKTNVSMPPSPWTPESSHHFLGNMRSPGVVFGSDLCRGLRRNKQKYCKDFSQQYVSNASSCYLWETRL